MGFLKLDCIQCIYLKAEKGTLTIQFQITIHEYYWTQTFFAHKQKGKLKVVSHLKKLFFSHK